MAVHTIATSIMCAENRRQNPERDALSINITAASDRVLIELLLADLACDLKPFPHA
tara:strand:- start:206 stop:373 length:168 start_codon:yes stop_codon:yes gene_type:complete